MSEQQEGITPQVKVKPTIGMTDENGFSLVYVDINSLGEVWRHELVLQTVDDYSEVYEIAIDFAKDGKKVKMLPIIDDPTHHLRDKLFNGCKPNKCPDLCVENKYVDVKTPEPDPSLNALDNNVKKGAKQADIVVIRVLGIVPHWVMERIVKFRFNKHSSLQKIIFKVIGKKTYTFDRVNFTR